MMTRLIGLGAGGHAQVVIELLRLTGQYELVGLLDASSERPGRHLQGVPVLGSDALLMKLARQNIRHFVVGIASASDTGPRAGAYARAAGCGLAAVSAVHPRAVVSPSAQVGPGVIVLAAAVVNAGASLGANVLVNTGAIVEHDCVVGDHAHVATGARLLGNVRVGVRAHIGAGAIVRQGVAVGAEAVVGAGAVVLRDVPDHTVVAGVPARRLPQKPGGPCG